MVEALVGLAVAVLMLANTALIAHQDSKADDNTMRRGVIEQVETDDWEKQLEINDAGEA